MPPLIHMRTIQPFFTHGTYWRFLSPLDEGVFFPEDATMDAISSLYSAFSFAGASCSAWKMIATPASTNTIASAYGKTVYSTLPSFAFASTNWMVSLKKVVVYGRTESS